MNRNDEVVSRRNRRGSRLLAVALAGLLAVCSALPGRAEAIDLKQEVSLTVVPGSEEMLEDLATADVVVDLYQVAAAEAVEGVDTYRFAPNTPFESLGVESPDITNEQWRAAAQAAAKLVLTAESTVKPSQIGVPVNTKTALLDGPGLYLVVARPNGETELANYVTTLENGDLATIANSAVYKYTYGPELVALPGREGADGSNNTANNDAPWQYDVTIRLKPSRVENLGSLVITKSLSEFETKDPATFVFQIEATLDGKSVYSDAISIVFDAPGKKSEIIEGIPVGAEVTVTEVYSGANYKAQAASGTATIVAADKMENMATVSFTNTYNDTYRGGGSIDNHFTGGADGWSWNGEREDGTKNQNADLK